jgi:hypothetical protein
MAEDVSTSMDQLVELLEKNSAIKVSEAARLLDADKERVESWARMLEKAEILQIHYSIVGGAILKRGPKFETVLRSAKKQVPLPLEPAAPKPPEKPAVTAPQERKPMAMADETAGEYLLIRKRIDDEESVIKSDLQKLREAQVSVVKYMADLECEQKKLAEYAESLHLVVDKMGKKVNSAAGTNHSIASANNPAPSANNK